MRSVGLFVLMFLCCVGCSADGPPSRKDVAQIVRQEFLRPEYDRRLRITLAYATGDGEGREIPARADQQRIDCVKALVLAGLLTPPRRAGTDRIGYRAQADDVFVWTATPMQAARMYVRDEWRHKLWDHFQAPAVEVVVATPNLVEVTGITAPTEGFGPPFVQATFSYRYSLTPFGEAIAGAQDCPGRQEIPESDMQAGVINFQKYDDGWRHDDPAGAFGVPLKLH